MDNQVLTIEQVKELNSLGLDTDFGSMYWHNYNTIKDPQYTLCSTADFGDITTLTLQDLLTLLPKPCYLNCIDNDFYQCQIVTDNGSTTASGKTAITAIFNMVKLYLENHKKKKYNVTRSFTHFEFSEVEANSYKEAIQLAEKLEEEDWEVDANYELTEQWIYEADEISK